MKIEVEGAQSWSFETPINLPMKTKQEILKSLKRELGMRIAIYPRRVRDNKMKQDQADHEIECLRAAVEIVEGSSHFDEPKQQPLL